jgi:hypothetical protein
MDLYEAMLAELFERKCRNVREHAAYYVCSVGAHLFNLVNRRKHIYVTSGQIPDLRLHILMSSPPGFSKTFWIEQFLRGEHALLVGSGIDVVFEQTMTEAGFVGTVKFSNGQIVHIPGLAELHKNAIVGVEEFSAITMMLQQQYSQQLDVALLSALDSGWVKKRLAGSGERPIEYRTNITLFAGVQPARYDLSSGLGRRFFFLSFIPTARDFQEFKVSRRTGRGVRYNPFRSNLIRLELKQLQDRLNTVEEIEFADRVDKLFDECDLLHYEEMLFERLLIGYAVMKGWIEKTLKVDVDDEARRLVQEGVKHRREIQKGAEFAMVVSVIAEHGGKITRQLLSDRLLKYGLDWREAGELISEMLRLHLIGFDGQRVYLR